MPTTRLTKLLAKRAAMDASIRCEQAKLKTQQRRDETRRKILAGAMMLDHAASDAAFADMLHRRLDAFLVRTDDRALFGLPPLTQDNAVPTQHETDTPLAA